MVALAGTQENELINIGAGEEYSIRHFAHLICEQVGYPVSEIKFDTDRYLGAFSKCLSTAKLDALLPDRTSTPVSRRATANDQVIEAVNSGPAVPEPQACVPGQGQRGTER